jgi:hypothetical protein
LRSFARSRCEETEKAREAHWPLLRDELALTTQAAEVAAPPRVEGFALHEATITGPLDAAP